MSRPDGFVALARPHEGELEVKRSRFLTFLTPVTTEDEARAAIAAARAAHPMARHHCTAFVLASRGPGHPAVARSNDDGEPSGTAGAPMLEALQSFGATGGDGQHGVGDALAVVVRYFGGVLLGAGGLTRAYRAAVADTLATAPLVRRSELELLGVTLDYPRANTLDAEAARRGWSVEHTYGAAVDVLLGVPPAELAEATARVAALTAGEAEPVRLGTRWVDRLPGPPSPSSEEEMRRGR
ncbi:putative YigZ family protein [Salana multivorans]|uniref:Putative YigZ family protein n=1 Tax=Salana multivorans TaxID=120377 RepID=A0A3N2D726_9MICO|nr:YigZ family protein [Salana multivorans]OJX94797.1 MAG: hypothetical protein BGO96_01705 [Micrococcales bacterium 73-15]ROR95552.1 putative YigZ family protein [Salana multivorans]